MAATQEYNFDKGQRVVFTVNNQALRGEVRTHSSYVKDGKQMDGRAVIKGDDGKTYRIAESKLRLLTKKGASASTSQPVSAPRGRKPMSAKPATPARPRGRPAKKPASAPSDVGFTPAELKKLAALVCNVNGFADLVSETLLQKAAVPRKTGKTSKK